MQGSEEKLVERCLKGDAHAWETLLQSYVTRIYNMAYRYTRRFDIAEELTQEIFLKVYQNLSSFRSGAGTLQNWILRVGRNLLIDYYRAHRRERQVAGSQELETLEFTEHSNIPSPYESLQARERAEFVMNGLEVLNPELKEAVLLRDIDGLSYQEIASLLEIPEGTVKSRINRGRIELAKVLGRSEQQSL